MRYLLDANSIITPFHQDGLRSLSVGMRHSSTSQTSQFLQDWFTHGFRTGVLVATQKLVGEVCEKQDAAGKLMKQLCKDGHVSTLEPRAETITYLRDVTAFVKMHFEAHQADKFLGEHDPELIAFAKTYGTGIITVERHIIPQLDGASGKIKGKVPLPYIAWVFGVPCIPLFYAFLRIGQGEAEESGTIEELSPGA